MQFAEQIRNPAQVAQRIKSKFRRCVSRKGSKKGQSPARVAQPGLSPAARHVTHFSASFARWAPRSAGADAAGGVANRSFSRFSRRGARARRASAAKKWPEQNPRGGRAVARRAQCGKRAPGAWQVWRRGACPGRAVDQRVRAPPPRRGTGKPLGQNAGQCHAGGGTPGSCVPGASAARRGRSTIPPGAGRAVLARLERTSVRVPLVCSEPPCAWRAGVRRVGRATHR